MYTEPIGGRDMISTFLWREKCEEATMPHMKGILFFSNSKYPSFFFSVTPSLKSYCSPIQPKKVLKFGDSGMLTA